MSEYTKGKWKKQLYSNGYEIFADDKEETYIAGINEDNPNHKANAQLIETAPELLETLEEMLDWTDEFMPEETFELGGYEITERARNLVAKAKGEIDETT